ncbi:ATP-binding protein [Rhizocola hellebori]|uniref:ATP-binding protein n=1 Tax=Rhizocola hellebori TaxID=1392758 RepID=UPI001940ABF7|nr:tetratricopeptide repeat protein [Rhizocola hellebori]
MFGRIIVAHRRRLNLTQECLADRTGLNVRSIRDLEADRVRAPRMSTVALLAEAFGLHGPERERFCLQATGAVADSPPDAIVPMQLPSDVAGFVGRSDELVRLDALLAEAAEGNGPVVISAVCGAPGVGKTALAVHWAHRVAACFPDGQLYVNLRGFDPAGHVASAGEALRGFLDGLGIPAKRVPPELGAQMALYRSVLAGKRMLVILDNARDADQVRPLLPGSSTVLAVVTSRNQLTGLVAGDGAHPLALTQLSPAEARSLLGARLGADRVESESEAVTRVVSACAGLPLALTLAAARCQLSGFAIETIADELAEAGRRLDVLDGGDAVSQMRTVFSWSYLALSASAADLFRLLGLHPGPDFSEDAAASAIGQPVIQTRRLLNELTRASLLAEHLPNRYRFHDLLRVYAADLCQSHDSVQARDAAMLRILDHYLQSAYGVDRLLNPHRDPITLGAPLPGVVLASVSDPVEALAWFATEHATLLSSVEHAAQQGFDNYAWQLALALTDFLQRRGYWQDWVQTGRRAVLAAGRLGDRGVQVRTHRNLGHAYLQLGRLLDADAELRRAIDLCRQLNDHTGHAHAMLNLAVVWERRGQLAEGLGAAQQAVELYRVAGHQRGQARAVNAVGWYHALQGNHEQAISACEQALILLEELGDQFGQAATLDSVALAYHHLGRLSDSIDAYQRALGFLRHLGNRYYEATVLTHLAECQCTNKDRQNARDNLAKAHEIFTDLGCPEAEAVATSLCQLDHLDSAG